MPKMSVSRKIAIIQPNLFSWTPNTLFWTYVVLHPFYTLILHLNSNFPFQNINNLQFTLIPVLITQGWVSTHASYRINPTRYEEKLWLMRKEYVNNLVKKQNAFQFIRPGKRLKSIVNFAPSIGRICLSRNIKHILKEALLKHLMELEVF